MVFSRLFRRYFPLFSIFFTHFLTFSARTYDRTCRFKNIGIFQKISTFYQITEILFYLDILQKNFMVWLNVEKFPIHNLSGNNLPNYLQFDQIACLLFPFYTDTTIACLLFPVTSSKLPGKYCFAVFSGIYRY